MKNKSKVAVLFLLITLFAIWSFAQNESKVYTQGDIAKYIAEKKALAVDNKTPAGYAKALEGIGVRPSEGWNLSKPITKPEFEVLLVTGGGLQAEVLAGETPKVVLEKRGIVIPDKIDNKTLSDSNVSRVLQALEQSGPLIPFPGEGGVVVDKPTPQVEVTLPPPKELPKVETTAPEPELSPIEPPTTEPPRPSGGGAQ